MDDVELNINNYTFQDILNLFKINIDYNENDVAKCKENVKKIYSSNELSLEYCNLFQKFSICFIFNIIPIYFLITFSKLLPNPKLLIFF